VKRRTLIPLILGLAATAALGAEATAQSAGSMPGKEPIEHAARSIRLLHPAATGTARASAAATRSPRPRSAASTRSSQAGSPAVALTGSRSTTADRGFTEVTVADINDRGQIVGSLSTKYSGRGFMWQHGSLRILGQGQYASAAAINERGQIIGTSTSGSASNSPEGAALWENGRMRYLGFVFVTAINERGQIIGSRAVPRGNGYVSAPVTWENGTVRELSSAIDGSALAAAVNDRGQIVGTTAGRAVVWQNGTITDLGPGEAVDINEHGEIVGERHGHVVVWRDGGLTDLGPGTPLAINALGQIVWSRLIARGPVTIHAFLWRNGTATDLGTLGGTWSIPTAISDRGQVVGWSTDARGVAHGFVWQNGTMTLLPSPTGDERTQAIAINDRNQIIGDNCYGDCGYRSGPLSGSKFAVLWTLHPHRIDTLQILSTR
jgi:probable HAF family extracellular repeat protein